VYVAGSQLEKPVTGRDVREEGPCKHCVRQFIHITGYKSKKIQWTSL